MPDDLVIDLSLDGLGDALRDAQNFAKEMRAAYDPTMRIQRMFGQTQTTIKKAASDMGQLARTTRMAARSAQPTGPQRRALQANTRLRANPMDFDVQFAAFRANRALMNAQRQMSPVIKPTNFGQQVARAIASTRIGVGANGVNVMPLIGQTLRLFGQAAPAVGATVTAVTALASAAWEGAKKINELNAARWGAGGRFGDVEQMRRVAAALGMESTALMGGPRELAGKLGSHDPWATMAGLKAGVSNPLGGTPFGNLNEMKDWLKAAKAVATTPSDAQAIRMARALGMEAILPMRSLPMDEIQDRFKKAEGPIDEESARRAADAQRRYGDFKKAIEDGMMAGFNSIWSGRVTSPFGASAGEMKRNPAARQMESAEKTLRSQDRLSGSLNGLSDDLHGLTLTLKGIFGGGDRARGAIPRAMLGTIAYQEGNVLRQAATLGAFAL